MSKIIHELQQYEISKVIVKDISWVQKNQNKQPQVEYVPKINMYYWFYYICKYGIEYNKTLELATQDKFKQIEIIRENTSGLKLLKLKKQTFEEDIIYAKHIHISTLKVLAYYNQLSLLVLKNGCYYFFNYGKVVHVLENNKMYTPSEAGLEEIVNNNYCIPMVDKIMYSMSHYKVSDLQNIAKQLNIPYHKVLKTELYNSIKIKLTQII
tara:strand:+ start:5972 stop:6601 length:630 start_codon:yes stop_codon:yes gene_type:complete